MALWIATRAVLWIVGNGGLCQRLCIGKPKLMEVLDFRALVHVQDNMCSYVTGT